MPVSEIQVLALKLSNCVPMTGYFTPYAWFSSGIKVGAIVYFMGLNIK